MTTVTAPPTVAVERASRATDMGCRVLDVVVAAVALIVLSPVLLAIAALIRLDSPGWVVFRQRRVGRDLDEFTVNKFRTMRADADHEKHRAYVLGLIAGRGDEDRQRPMLKLAGDDRITRVGAHLRRTSLDELPQLWNVLRGDMSLVGPRPPIPYEVEQYREHWLRRFAVKPGLTGLWQVNGRSEVSVEDMMQLDIEYVRRRSVWLNVKIIVRTIPVVLSCRGAG
jgi:lipopolysaccharide/colanic/teichoic acid biosynthesis glycosyltransferase